MHVNVDHKPDDEVKPAEGSAQGEIGGVDGAGYAGYGAGDWGDLDRGYYDRAPQYDGSSYDNRGWDTPGYGSYDSDWARPVADQGNDNPAEAHPQLSQVSLAPPLRLLSV